ncbi:MAG: energy transducer TonB [Pasteurellaceae bacterium]|nr:energy transducer TonB [Pasteurellaceae bacterium]
MRKLSTQSLVGFLVSLSFHCALFYGIWYALRTDDSANSQSAETIATNISMEMMMATVVDEPPPESEQEVAPEPEKEAVADPTLKKAPEKPKEKVKSVEKPIEKPKPKKKPREKSETKAQPKEVTKVKEKSQQVNDAEKSDKVVVSAMNANSKATAVSANVNSSNPNLAGTGASASEIDGYKAAIRREIERNKVYPQRAKMMRKQGTVTVAFTIGADGSLSGERVINSSGSEDLDNAALQAVQRARAVGARPAGMPSSLTVPIKFAIM